MWCYVGKATKIFFFVVAVLVVVGLVLGFGFIRRGPRSSRIHGGCGDSDSCQPALPPPIPASAAASAPPLLSPPSPAAVGQAPFPHAK